MFQINITSQNKPFQNLLNSALKSAKSDYPVLILGETGAGKEVLARHIHLYSHRKQQPLVAVNCGTIPFNLFESEFFGYEKGAFSGAVIGYKGLVRSAHKGTLFLDEIGDLDLASQVKLLRFIDSGEVRSLGSNKTDYLDCRIIAATNANIPSLVARGEFRQDLYERLSVFRYHVPPLRERKEDLGMLANLFAKELGAEINSSHLQILSDFDWPGNIRQLKNVIVRSFVIGENKITSETLRGLIREEKQVLLDAEDSSEIFSEGSLADIERQAIIDRLKRYHGNRKLAAKDLGIAKSTLHGKIRKWKGQNHCGWPIERYSF